MSELSHSTPCNQTLAIVVPSCVVSRGFSKLKALKADMVRKTYRIPEWKIPSGEWKFFQNQQA